MTRTTGICALVALASAFLVGIVPVDPPERWAMSAALLVLFCGALGVALNGRAGGLLIDQRNRMSLARLQAAGWSILVLSAVTTAVLIRTRSGASDPANINIPAELLMVMGISATSLIAVPTILNLKAADTTNASAAEAAAKVGEDPTKVCADGRIYARTDPAHASWLDIFRGEEICAAATPDLSKIQQFLVTAATMAAYGAALWQTFSAPVGDVQSSAYLAALPSFSPNMLWLIGLSHAGYIANKAAPHGPSSSAKAATSATAGDPVG